MREIELTQGKVALVDDEDFGRLSQHKWCAANIFGKWYAVRSVNGKLIYMHREILEEPSQLVDHRDGDGLNNRRTNLRPATHQQNVCNRGLQRNNTSGYKGVHWSKGMKKWAAVIGHFGSRTILGYFDDPKHAADAYDAKAIELFGAFARPNSSLA